MGSGWSDSVCLLCLCLPSPIITICHRRGIVAASKTRARASLLKNGRQRRAEQEQEDQLQKTEEKRVKVLWSLALPPSPPPPLLVLFLLLTSRQFCSHFDFPVFEEERLGGSKPCWNDGIDDVNTIRCSRAAKEACISAAVIQLQENEQRAKMLRKEVTLNDLSHLASPQLESVATDHVLQKREKGNDNKKKEPMENEDKRKPMHSGDTCASRATANIPFLRWHLQWVLVWCEGFRLWWRRQNDCWHTFQTERQKSEEQSDNVEEEKQEKRNEPPNCHRLLTWVRVSISFAKSKEKENHQRRDLHLHL